MLSRIAAHFRKNRWIRRRDSKPGAAAEVRHHLQRQEDLHIPPEIHRWIRSNRERVDELRSLLEEQKVVILKPFLGSKDAGAHAVSEELVLDYVRSHRTIRIAPDKVHLFFPGAVFLREPLALLSIPTSHNDYLNAVGRNPRKMIRRATKRGFSFREFAWNDHLDDIYAINTSKVRRCAGIMRGWYTQPVRPRFHPENELPYRKYFGAFRDNRLRGYLHLLIAGDNAFFKHILGHGDDLSCGIMNGLVFFTVQQFIGHPTVRWFKYSSLLRQHSGGLASFQRHIGFSGYATVLDLASHPDLLARVSAVESRWWAV